MVYSFCGKDCKLNITIFLLSSEISYKILTTLFNFFTWLRHGVQTKAGDAVWLRPLSSVSWFLIEPRRAVRCRCSVYSAAYRHFRVYLTSNRALRRGIISAWHHERLFVVSYIVVAYNAGYTSPLACARDRYQDSADGDGNGGQRLFSLSSLRSKRDHAPVAARRRRRQDNENKVADKEAWTNAIDTSGPLRERALRRRWVAEEDRKGSRGERVTGGPCGRMSARRC